MSQREGGRDRVALAFGAVFIVLGIVFLLDRFEAIDLRPGILLPLLLIAAGIAIALSALLPSRD
jgi:hypothetical protein